MSLKYVLVAVFGIISLQAAVEAYSYMEAIDEVEKLRRNIDTASNIAVQITELDLIKLQQLTLNRENLELRYQMYFSVIDQLNTTALQNKIPVTSCLTTFPKLTQNYQNVTTFYQKNCLNKNSTIPSNLTSAIIALRENTNVPYNLLSDLNKCNFESSCIDKVVVSAKSTGNAVPQAVVNLITNNELLVYKTSTPLPQCQQSIEDGLQAAVTVAEVIVKCLSTAVFAK